MFTWIYKGYEINILKVKKEKNLFDEMWMMFLAIFSLKKSKIEMKNKQEHKKNWLSKIGIYNNNQTEKKHQIWSYKKYFNSKMETSF